MPRAPDALDEPQHAVMVCKKILHLRHQAARRAQVCQLYWTGTTGMFERPILITGGAGFIGSHLSDALLARGAACAGQPVHRQARQRPWTTNG